MRRRAGALAFFAVALASAASPARAEGVATEFDLRSYTYTFESPGNALGPWHALKADASAAFGDDVLVVRAVDGNHDDRSAPAHGEFVRIEDAHRFDSRFELKVAAGTGSGYQPLRTATAEFVAALDRGRHVSLAVGDVLTSQNNVQFQRIYAYGSDLRFGAVGADARLYEPVQTSPDRRGPSTLSLDAAVPIGRRLLAEAHGNFGGEVGGDRTASQLPTSSGRVGPDVALSFKFAAVPNGGLLATYEEASYRTPLGAFAYLDRVVFVGAFIRFVSEGHRR